MKVRSSGDPNDGGRVTQASQAYRLIEEMIVRGELEPGEALSVPSLSDKLHIGRTPVQEAVKQLALNEMVSVVARQGIKVSAIRFDQMRALMQARRPLERLLARFAARNATPAERLKLRAAADELLAAARRGDEDAVIDADGRLKQLLIASARNGLLEAAIGPIYAHFRRLYFLAVPAPSLEVAVAFGRAYSAIADGQEAEAVAAIDAVMEKIDHATKASMVLLAPTDRIVASEET
jgi:DNA-binding GntR family transcriptional regulator